MEALGGGLTALDGHPNHVDYVPTAPVRRPVPVVALTRSKARKRRRRGTLLDGLDAGAFGEYMYGAVETALGYVTAVDGRRRRRREERSEKRMRRLARMGRDPARTGFWAYTRHQRGKQAISAYRCRDLLSCG